MRDDRERLTDILEANEHIQRYSGRGRDAFDNDELIQTWIVHHLQIIGEAARVLSEETRDAASQIPRSKIIGMRHILVHHYFGIDAEIVWNVVQNELPRFEGEVRTLRNQLPIEDDADDSEAT